MEEARLAAIQEAKKPIAPKLSETTLSVMVDFSDEEDGDDEEEVKDEQGGLCFFVWTRAWEGGREWAVVSMATTTTTTTTMVF